MQPILVMGPPGSGKSTLASLLGVGLGLPVFHLDQAYWQSGWTRVPPDRFQAEVERLTALPAWIIDGNYTDTLAPRLSRADMVVYLDMPRWRSMVRIILRILRSYERVRSDAAPGCPERIDLPFLRFAWSWNRTRRARNLALIERFPGRKVFLHNRTDLHQFLAT